MTGNKRICIGHVIGAHGIQGELVVRSYAETPEAIGRYRELTDEAGSRRFRVRSARAAGKGVILRIEGVGDRNGAEALKGVALFVDRQDLPETEDNEYYHADLIGLEVVEVVEGRRVGRIADVVNYGAGDLLEITPEAGGPTVLVPFTDELVPKVDFVAGRVVVADAAGLLGSGEEPDDTDPNDA